MIIRERAIDAGAVSGAVALVVAAWWMAGVVHERDQLRASPARPTPTVTVTASQVPGTGRTSEPAPRTSQSMSRPDTGVTAAAAREPRTQAVSAAEQRPGPGIPSGPSPAPPQRPSTSCTGIAAVQLLHRCAFTIGGSR